MAKQKDLVNSSVAEFLGCWAVGGKANLTLDTVNGVTTVSFTTTLPGHPESPLHPPPLPADAPAAPTPPPSPPRRPRHRGPAQRERNNERAARHQAALAGTASAASNSLSLTTASVVNTTITASVSPVKSTLPGSVTLTSSIPEQVFKCKHCELCFKNEKGLNIHIGKAHKVLKTPEKERSPYVAEEPVLTLTPTPVSGRAHEEEIYSPEKLSDSDELVNETFEQNELWCRKCYEKDPSNDKSWYLLPNRPAMKAHMHNEHMITIFEDINIDMHGGFRNYRI